MSDQSVKRWHGPNALNVPTEWVTLRASDYDALAADIERLIAALIAALREEGK